MKKSTSLFTALLLLSMTLFSACTSTDFDLFKEDDVTGLSESSKNSNEYVFSTEEYYALNQYLTIFVRLGYMREQAFNLSTASNDDLGRISQLYCSLEYQDALEFGNFADGADCRIEEQYLQGGFNKLFKLDLDIGGEGMENLFFKDGYCYWNSELLTETNSNFALINKVEIMGNYRYSITFTLYDVRGEANEAENSEFFSYSHDRAIREFPRGSISDLSAIVHTENLSDIDSFTLDYMQKNTASS